MLANLHVTLSPRPPYLESPFRFYTYLCPFLASIISSTSSPYMTRCKATGKKQLYTEACPAPSTSR